MNTGQEILNVLLKMMYTKEFESSFTDKEFDLLGGINASFNGFKVERAIDGSELGITIIRWESLIHKTVACTVSEGGFYFSVPQLYKTSTKRLKGLVREHPPFLTMIEIVESEIQTLKNLFLEYSPDVERYLK